MKPPCLLWGSRGRRFKSSRSDLVEIIAQKGSWRAREALVEPFCDIYSFDEVFRSGLVGWIFTPQFTPQNNKSWNPIKKGWLILVWNDGKRRTMATGIRTDMVGARAFAQKIAIRKVE